jgi:quinol monooxygenase YgiN
MMMIVMLKIVLPNKRRQEVLEALHQFKKLAEISFGCVRCHITQDVDKPDTIIYSEEWECRDALEKHIRSSKYRHLLEIIELSAQAPEIKFYTVSKTEGLEVVEAIRFS